MMKSILNYTAAFAAMLAAASCQKEMKLAHEVTAPEEPAVKEYTLSVNASKGEDTKALSLDGKTLNVKWADTDQVSVFPESWATPAMGTLTAAASETGSTTLTGSVTGAAINDKLNLLFPRAEWNYTGQKGILLSDENSIEKKYDYAAAQVTVSEVVGTTITTNTANFTSQQAIVKFRLTYGGSPIAVDDLTISANSGKLVTKKSYKGTGDKSYYSGAGYYTVDGGSGGFGGEQHGNLVDNNLSTKWCTDGSGWYIEFHTASAIQVDGYMLRTAGDTGSEPGRNPKDWVLKGKNEGDPTWTTIDTKSNNHDMPAASNTPQDFDAEAPGTYKYFRLEITANQSGGIMQLSEMQLFKYNSYEMGTSYGDITVTPDAAASEFTVALRNENAGADTYNLSATAGGITYVFSKEGITFVNGKYYDIRVPMAGRKVESITLNKSSINLTIGSSQTLSVTSVLPEDAGDKSVTWSSSNTSVATVNPSTGEVTAVAEGTATITATANDDSGTTATCTVKVYPAGTVVWDPSNWGNQYYDDYSPCTIDGITLTMSGYAKFRTGPAYAELQCSDPDTGNYTFTAPAGKKFTKIEINGNDNSGWEYNNPMTSNGWAITGGYMTNYKATWTGNANTVKLFDSDSHFGFMPEVYSILFLVQ